MGSNADFMENGLKPEEYAYPSNSSKIKNRHETFITPTKSHENKTPRVFFHPASIGDGPRPPPDPSKPPKTKTSMKFGPLGPQVLLSLFRQPLGYLFEWVDKPIEPSNARSARGFLRPPEW